jgi:hypothetical protein
MGQVCKRFNLLHQQHLSTNNPGFINGTGLIAIAFSLFIEPKSGAKAISQVVETLPPMLIRKAVRT